MELSQHPIHLGLGATAVPQPPITDMSWYDDYTSRTEDDGHEGRLVSLHHFDQPWDQWEMHPHGHEVVLCVEGTMVLHQEREGEATTVTLTSGQYAINQPGVWHIADAHQPVTALFITAGVGTRHRPR